MVTNSASEILDSLYIGHFFCARSAKSWLFCLELQGRVGRCGVYLPIFHRFFIYLFIFLQERSAQARIMDLESQLSRSTQSTQLLKRTKEEVCQQSFSLKK